MACWTCADVVLTETHDIVSVAATDEVSDDVVERVDVVEVGGEVEEVRVVEEIRAVVLDDGGSDEVWVRVVELVALAEEEETVGVADVDWDVVVTFVGGAEIM